MFRAGGRVGTPLVSRAERAIFFECFPGGSACGPNLKASFKILRREYAESSRKYMILHFILVRNENTWNTRLGQRVGLSWRRPVYSGSSRRCLPLAFPALVSQHRPQRRVKWHTKHLVLRGVHASRGFYKFAVSHLTHTTLHTTSLVLPFSAIC